jgi:hypothetical protein
MIRNLGNGVKLDDEAWSVIFSIQDENLSYLDNVEYILVSECNTALGGRYWIVSSLFDGTARKVNLETYTSLLWAIRIYEEEAPKKKHPPLGFNLGEPD